MRPEESLLDLTDYTPDRLVFGFQQTPSYKILLMLLSQKGATIAVFLLKA
jgi:hypothetical protein